MGPVYVAMASLVLVIIFAALKFIGRYEIKQPQK